MEAEEGGVNIWFTIRSSHVYVWVNEMFLLT